MNEAAAQLERERKEIEELRAQMAAEEAALQREQEMLAAEQLQEQQEAAAAMMPGPAEDEAAAQLERERREVEALRAQMAEEESALQREQEMLAAEQVTAPAAAVPEPAPAALLGGEGDDEAAAQLERDRQEVESLKAQMASDEAALAETRLVALHEVAHGPDGTQELVTAADIAEAEHRLRDHWLSEGEVGDRNRREEMVHDSVGEVVMRDTAGALFAGWLAVTSYRVVFLPRDTSRPLTAVMLSGIEEIESIGELPSGNPGLAHKYAHIRLRAKDARALFFIRDDGLSESMSKDANTSLVAIAEMMRFQGGGTEGGGGRKRFLSKLKVPGHPDEADTTAPELTRLCQFQEKTVAQMRAQSCEAPRGNDSPYLETPAQSDAQGLGYFDMEADFKRMGVGTRESNWRVTRANDGFLLCGTYPRL